jgi:methionyl-tRNA formyltransferase
MTNRIFFVVNRLEDFDFPELLRKYLSGFVFDIGESPPPQPCAYALVVLWNYQKIVSDLPEPNNIVVFHGSDLPDGRGWAPIFYAISEEHAEYCITGILAAPEVDRGDVLVKARFPLKPEYTASDLRRFDREISIRLVFEIVSRFSGRALKGSPQHGEGSYRPRRRLSDNELGPDKTLAELIPILRAAEDQHPTFFRHAGKIFRVRIEPEQPAEFPDNVEISFP